MSTRPPRLPGLASDMLAPLSSPQARKVVNVDLPPVLVGGRLLLDQADLLVRLGPALHVQHRALVRRQHLQLLPRAQRVELLLRLCDGHGALEAARVQDFLHDVPSPLDQPRGPDGIDTAHWFFPSSHSEACSSRTMPGERLAATIF